MRLKPIGAYRACCKPSRMAAHPIKPTTQAALVEVDTGMGRVEVLKVIAAHDVGRAINPQAIAEQLEGGVVMGKASLSARSCW